MNFSIQDDCQPAVASKAILFYESAGRFGSKQVTFASVHDIQNVGSKTKPNPQIMPGTPVTNEALIDLMTALSQKLALSTELLPENVLSFSPSHLVWWTPAQKRRVFFNNKELGKKSSITPHPPLLFMIHNRTWFVFSLKENKRPDKNTMLFHAPYFNVYDDASICIGSAAIPNRLTTTSIPEWERAFFESEFTHVNGRIKKASYPRGEYAMWKDLLTGELKEFPIEHLVSTKMTLDSKMRELSKSLGVTHG